MKDQLSGQLKMLIVSYTAGHITGYYVPFNLNFVQYFWLVLANIFLVDFKILA